MMIAERPRTSYAWAGLAAALAAGAAVLFWNLTKNSLFLDEAFTFHISSYPLAGLIDNVVNRDEHPPLFYILTHFLLTWIHIPAERYRIFNAPFGLLTIVATWAIGRRLFGDAAATVAALLTALAPGLLDADRIYRMYAPLAALMALSWWLLLAAEDDRARLRGLRWAGYAACAIALPYVHYLGALTVAGQVLYALADVRKRWPCLAIGATAVLAFVPWLWALKIQFAAGGHAVPPGFDQWVVPQGTLLAGAPIGWRSQPYFTPVVCVVTFGLLAGGLWAARRSALPFMFAGVVLQLILSVALHKSLLVPRYLDAYSPAFALAVAALYAVVADSRWRVAAIGMTAAIVACFAVCDANLILDPFYQRTDWYLVNNYIRQRERPGDAMLFVQGFPVLVVGTYPAFVGHDAETPYDPSVLPHARAWLDAHKRARIWYIENEYWFADQRKELLTRLVRTRPVVAAWLEKRADASDMVTVVLFGQESDRSHGRQGLKPSTTGH